MTRTIRESNVSIKIFQPSEKISDVREWLEKQTAGYHEPFWLLAHADDGVIWGKVFNGKLVTAPVDFSMLETTTLQNARLFNRAMEIYLWRDGDGIFQARSVQEGAGEPRQYFDEEQILWGNHAEKRGDFTLMSDGLQGLRHCVPLEVEVTKNFRPLRLKVRHYLVEDVTGFVRVAFSRLVDLTSKKLER